MSLAEHDRIPEIALAWRRAGKGVALATVIETWGSAPRPVGAQLVISAEAEIMGSVSGGCVEGAVVVEALEAMADGRPRILEFGVSDDEAFAVGLACGGRIRIAVEPVGTGLGLHDAMLADLVAARDAARPVALVTDHRDWSRRLAGYAEHATRFDADRSGFDESAPAVFVSVHSPPLRIAVIGAAHIAQPLVLMAEATGYAVSIIDPRESFASESRFPGQSLSHDWPDEALTAFGPDLRSAVVTLSHDPKIDDPALGVAIRSEAFYIGALGSTRTHAKRCARLAEAGYAPAEIARIEAPIGLDIGARNPAEIAVAIMAQMTERLRRPETRPSRAPVLRDGTAA